MSALCLRKRWLPHFIKRNAKSFLASLNKRLARRSLYLNALSSLPGPLFLSFALLACGASDDNGTPSGTQSGTDSGVVECVKVTETETNCSDGVDDNCDGKTDCENVECSFDPFCLPPEEVPVEGCGEASYAGDPLAIPDGNGMAYVTSINIDGFDDGQLLESAAGFVSACVVMEHSWLRDLQIEMICPSGQVMILQEYLGHSGSSIYMGEPNDDDENTPEPIPGVGFEYCWRADAVNEPMLEWANNNTGERTLPAGDYRPNTPTDALIGCSLNGDWSIRAIDDWGFDNGYIFEWTVNFSPDIIPDCNEWID